MVPEVQKPSQEPCIAFYPKRRIRNLLREKHFHGVSSGSRHEYLLKLRYGKVSHVDLDVEVYPPHHTPPIRRRRSAAVHHW